MTDVAEAVEVSVADGLRQVANFLDANPDLTASTYAIQMRCTTKQDLRVLTSALVAAVGRAEKGALGDNYFHVYASIGGLKVWGAVQREKVCRKVVTGTRHVPEQTVEAHEEEIVKWVCDDAILAGVGAVREDG